MAHTYLQWYELSLKIHHFSKIECSVCYVNFLSYWELLVTVAQILYNFTNSRGAEICPQLFSIPLTRITGITELSGAKKTPDLYFSSGLKKHATCYKHVIFLPLKLESYYENTCILIVLFNQLLGRNSCLHS